MSYAAPIYNAVFTTLEAGYAKPIPEQLSATAYTFRTRVVGRGYLAGEAPNGLTTNEGVPCAAEVRVLLRVPPGGDDDGALVAVVKSSAAGAWSVENLNPLLHFDVVARLDGFNDVIVSNVQPSPYDTVSINGGFKAGQAAGTLDSEVEILGGIPAYSVSVVAGTPPPGIVFTTVGHRVVADNSATASGTYAWTLEVTASNGVSARADFTVTLGP